MSSCVDFGSCDCSATDSGVSGSWFPAEEDANGTRDEGDASTEGGGKAK